MLFLETFPPQQSCSSIFLDLVIQNSHFLLYSDLYTVFYFHFCFQSVLWHWTKLFNVFLLFPLSLSVHHVLSGTVLHGKKEHFILTVNMWVLDEDDLSICSCTTEEGSAVGAERCTSDGTVGGHLAPLPAQIRSLDDHGILPVAIKVLPCFWLDFPML